MRAQLLKIVMGVFLSCLFVVSCADEEKEEVKFKVISYGGKFTGDYSADSETNIKFTVVGLGGNDYYYENTVEIKNQLEINADADSTTDANTMTSLEIKVYVDGSFVKNGSSTSSPITKFTVRYNKGDSATETTE